MHEDRKERENTLDAMKREKHTKEAIRKRRTSRKENDSVNHSKERGRYTKRKLRDTQEY